ncbi:MAG: hypothetical protein JNL98_10005 [Bryobacterales bacterium]|nr:hypothetical protein [Bryobacterales bacterium]
MIERATGPKDQFLQNALRALQYFAGSPDAMRDMQTLTPPLPDGVRELVSQEIRKLPTKKK